MERSSRAAGAAPNRAGDKTVGKLGACAAPGQQLDDFVFSKSARVDQFQQQLITVGSDVICLQSTEQDEMHRAVRFAGVIEEGALGYSLDGHLRENRGQLGRFAPSRRGCSNSRSAGNATGICRRSPLPVAGRDCIRLPFGVDQSPGAVRRLTVVCRGWVFVTLLTDLPAQSIHASGRPLYTRGPDGSRP